MRSSKHRVWAWGALLALMLGAAAPVWGAEPTAAERDEAKRLYVEGKKLRAEGKLAEATASLRRAHTLAPTPVTRLELARALEAAGGLTEALALYESIPALPQTATETQKSVAARREAESAARALAPRIPEVRFTLTPPDAEVVVVLDERPLEAAALGAPRRLDPGEHRVVARFGETAVETRFSLAEAEHRTVPLERPAPPPAPTPPPPAPTPVASAPSAPPAPTPAPPRAPEPAPPSRDSLLVPAAFTVAGVGLLTGIVTGAITLAQASDLEAQCPGGQCPPDSHDLLSANHTLATTSNVAFALAGAAAAVGTVAWLWQDGADEPAPKAGTTRVGVGPQGVVLQGAF